MFRSRVQLLVSGARSSSGESAVSDLGGDRAFVMGVFVLKVTAVSGTLPTLDAAVQTEMPDGSYADVAAFSTVATVSSRVAVVPTPEVGGVVEAALSNLSPGTVRAIPLGRRYKVRWTIAGTASPIFTFEVHADLLGQE